MLISSVTLPIHNRNLNSSQSELLSNLYYHAGPQRFSKLFLFLLNFMEINKYIRLSLQIHIISFNLIMCGRYFFVLPLSPGHSHEPLFSPFHFPSSPAMFASIPAYHSTILNNHFWTNDPNPVSPCFSILVSSSHFACFFQPFFTPVTCSISELWCRPEPHCPN